MNPVTKPQDDRFTGSSIAIHEVDIIYIYYLLKKVMLGITVRPLSLSFGRSLFFLYIYPGIIVNNNVNHEMQSDRR